MKNILLIGGSYGIGLEIVKILQSDNNIVVASRTRIDLNSNNIKYIPFDASIDNLENADLPSEIHGFVYCPGNINLRPFKGLKIETFEDDLRINFINMVKIVQGILPKLLASEQASIVLFSSIAVGTGMPFHTSVAASKGAVEGFAKALAAEFSPKIRVNVIAPSLTNTPLADKFLNNETKQLKASERHPLRRYGEPHDIAEMASFLISDKSSWISGQVFHVDGGMSSLLVNS